MLRKLLSVAIGMLGATLWTGMFLTVFGDRSLIDTGFLFVEIPLFIFLAGIVVFIVTTMWKDNL